jgi:hypothetical protein
MTPVEDTEIGLCEAVCAAANSLEVSRPRGCSLVASGHVVNLVLSIQAVYHVPLSCELARRIMSHNLRLAFEIAFKEGIELSPQELGFYPKLIHSPAHKRMMRRCRAMSASEKDEEEEQHQKLRTTLNPVSSLSLVALMQSARFACCGSTAEKQTKFEPKVCDVDRMDAEFTNLQTLRLLWYVGMYGAESSEWSSIRIMAFPDQGREITELKCEREWQRLLWFANQTVFD